MSRSEDLTWAGEIYEERAAVIDENQDVTYFFLKDYDRVRLKG